MDTKDIRPGARFRICGTVPSALIRERLEAGDLADTLDSLTE